MTELSKPDAAKLQVLFSRLAEHGLIQDGQKYERLEGEVWEFKARGADTGLRVTCYRRENQVILLTGFRKKEDDTDPHEVRRALLAMEEDRRLYPADPQRG